MPSLSRLTSTLALCMLSPLPALADISADQAWDDLVEWMESTGADVTFQSESRAGSTLTITGFSATSELDQNARSAIELPSLVFRENGDGTVSMDLPDTALLSVVGAPDMPETFDMVLSISGDEVTLSGDGAVERYEYAIETLGLSLPDGKITAEDGEASLVINLTAQNTSGAYKVTQDDLRRISSEGRIETALIDVEVDDLQNDDGARTFVLRGILENIATRSAGALPEDLDSPAAGAMIEAGLTSEGSFSYGPGSFAIASGTPNGTFEQAMDIVSGRFDIDLGPDGFEVETQSQDIALRLGGSFFPGAPLEFSLAESGMALALPLLPGDAPQTFRLALRMIDLVVPEALYAQIDPAGLIPRDPASFELETSGTLTLAEDFTAPEFSENPVIPGELLSFDVTTLRLALAGALLTGDAAFEFTTGEDGVPAPVGAAEIALEGGNTLLDSLVTIGLIPEQQVLAVRLMMGLFARPGPGEDNLTSTIEFKEDGSISANGQRIR